VRTVLVVDDEWAIADWLQALLADEGYQVFVASNGKEALKILSTQAVDLIITDFMMPIMDGPALIRAVADNTAIRHLPIIVMSSLQEAVVRERCAGYVAFVRKPFREADFLALVQRAVTKDP
jgi:CheY-like chemotaxis protein